MSLVIACVVWGVFMVSLVIACVVWGVFMVSLVIACVVWGVFMVSLVIACVVWGVFMVSLVVACVVWVSSWCPTRGVQTAFHATTYNDHRKTLVWLQSALLCLLVVSL